jgi:YggT family protein
MPVGNALIVSLLEVIDAVLDLYVWLLIISALLSWLIAFGVINSYSRAVRMFMDFVARITDPVLAPIRRIIPPVNGLDLSPLILIFIIYFIRSFIHHLVF